MRTIHTGIERAWPFESRRTVAQKTLRASIHCTGVGLHSGSRVRLTLHPAAPDSGIVFVRSDLPGQPEIPARWDHVVDTRMCTVLGGEDGATVGTVEHFMAACSGVGLDNVVAEIDGPELPVMDGSAEPFVFLIGCGGLADQPAPRRALRILEPVTVAADAWSATLSPGNGFTVGMDIDFANAVVARQSVSLDLSDGAFEPELSRARTFGFLEEVEQLRAAGLARGGSLDNVVVITGDRVMNADGLRYEDEFVRHKALDAVGDLYLAGAPIIGHFQGLRSGHAANNRLLHALFARPDAWEWDTLRAGDGFGAALASPGRYALEAVGSA